MEQAAVTSDERQRAGLLAQAETILLKDLPVLPIYFYVSKNMVSTKVRGWVDNPFNVHYARDLSLAD
jgi:ABC-type transport system substrate-binding protein